MGKLNKVIVFFVIAVVMITSVGCYQKEIKQQWEYKVVLYSRDDGKSGMEESLNLLADEGWEYAGPLANNGINAQYVAFKRLK